MRRATASPFSRTSPRRRNRPRTCRRRCSASSRSIAKRTSTDVCSIYLLEPRLQRLTLRATTGLERSAVGKVAMSVGEGLTGMAIEKLEPVMAIDAMSHPRYKFFPETGEERYHSFLGVPMLERGTPLGVLVVQTLRRRKFVRHRGAPAARDRVPRGRRPRAGASAGGPGAARRRRSASTAAAPCSALKRLHRLREPDRVERAFDAPQASRGPPERPGGGAWLRSRTRPPAPARGQLRLRRGPPRRRRGRRARAVPARDGRGSVHELEALKARLSTPAAGVRRRASSTRTG